MHIAEVNVSFTKINKWIDDILCCVVYQTEFFYITTDNIFVWFRRITNIFKLNSLWHQVLFHWVFSVPNWLFFMSISDLSELSLFLIFCLHFSYIFKGGLIYPSGGANLPQYGASQHHWGLVYLLPLVQILGHSEDFFGTHVCRGHICLDIKQKTKLLSCLIIE